MMLFVDKGEVTVQRAKAQKASSTFTWFGVGNKHHLQKSPSKRKPGFCYCKNIQTKDVYGIF